MLYQHASSCLQEPFVGITASRLMYIFLLLHAFAAHCSSPAGAISAYNGSPCSFFSMLLLYTAPVLQEPFLLRIGPPLALSTCFCCIFLQSSRSHFLGPGLPFGSSTSEISLKPLIYRVSKNHPNPALSHQSSKKCLWLQRKCKTHALFLSLTFLGFQSAQNSLRILKDLEEFSRILKNPQES